MFLNNRILEDRLKNAMHKYGIQQMDPEILFIMSEAMKNKYTEMIKELITISRSS